MKWTWYLRPKVEFIEEGPHTSMWVKSNGSRACETENLKDKRFIFSN